MAQGHIHTATLSPTRQAFAQAAKEQSVTNTELDYLLPDQWLKTHTECVWTIDEVRRRERQAARTSPPL